MLLKAGLISKKSKRTMIYAILTCAKAETSLNVKALLKTIKIAEDSGTKVLGVVVNRVKGHSYEMRGEEIKWDYITFL